MRIGNARRLTKRPLSGVWYRAVRPQFLGATLSFAHTATIPGRFNPGTQQHPGFPVLYLAENQLVALFEVNALLGSPLPNQPYAPNPGSPWSVVNVQVQLRSVADLTQSAERRIVDTTVQELTGDWRGYMLRNPSARLRAPHFSNVPTQRLGGALHSVPRLEGFITYSARVPTDRCLVVFPNKLATPSFIRFIDPTTGAIQSIP